jgi:Metallo-beta-lactamase superfamily
MRFVIGESVVDVVVDDDEFELPLSQFLPGLDLPALSDHCGLLEPDFVDLTRNTLNARFRHSSCGWPAGPSWSTPALASTRTDRRSRPGTRGLVPTFSTGYGAPASILLRSIPCSAPICTSTMSAGIRSAPTAGGRRPFYLVGRTELADWLARRDAGTAPAMHVRGLQDSVLPIIEAGLVDLVDDGHELARGLHLTLLPGHTMGQMGLRIDRPDGRAIFCGDTVHSPAQICQPSVSTSSCLDPDRAAETRQILFEEAAATRRLLVPAHFRGLRRAYVREFGTGFAPIFGDDPG